jgi:hypothetical protein
MFADHWPAAYVDSTASQLLERYPFLPAHLLDDCSAFADFLLAAYQADIKFALCFDEVEIAPDSITKAIIRMPRTINQRFLINSLGYWAAAKCLNANATLQSLRRVTTYPASLTACDANGLADFQLLRWRKRDDPAIFCAFDLIEVAGRDLRDEPIETASTGAPHDGVGAQPIRGAQHDLSAPAPLAWAVAIGNDRLQFSPIRRAEVKTDVVASHVDPPTLPSISAMTDLQPGGNPLSVPEH